MIKNDAIPITESPELDEAVEDELVKEIEEEPLPPHILARYDYDVGDYFHNPSYERHRNYDPFDPRWGVGDVMCSKPYYIQHEYKFSDRVVSKSNVENNILRPNVTNSELKKLHLSEYGKKSYLFRQPQQNNNNMTNVQFFRNVNDYSVSAYEQYARAMNADPIDTRVVAVRNVKVDQFQSLVMQVVGKMFQHNYYLVSDMSSHYDAGYVSYGCVYEQRFFRFERRPDMSCVFVEVYGKDGYATVSVLANQNMVEVFDELKTDLRETFKDNTEKKPVFYTISSSPAGFELKKLEINNLYHDVPLDNYNEDFEKVHTTVIECIDSKKKGLILFHGEPGTGKTCYIKHLISRQTERKIIYIPPHLTDSIAAPNFISFVRDHLQNSVLVIEDAETILQARDESYGSASAVSNLLNITDGILGDALNILIVCTFNMDAQRIDQALMRKGRLIAEYRFDKLKKDRANALMQKLHGKEATEDMTITDIYNYEIDQIKTPEKPKNKIGFY